MYVKVNNGQVETYPYTIGMLRKDHPNTSFPKTLSNDILENFNLFRVDLAPQPDYDNRTQRISQEQIPTLIDGNWVINWNVYDKSQDQIDRATAEHAEVVRFKRNELLQKCDWTQFIDSPLAESEKAAWTTYRQELRDLTAQAGFPYDIVWPVDPNGDDGQPIAPNVSEF